MEDFNGNDKDKSRKRYSLKKREKATRVEKQFIKNEVPPKKKKKNMEKQKYKLNFNMLEDDDE